MSEDSTGGTTSLKREAARVMAEVGGVRRSDDPVPDLWSGEPAEERRDVTCSAEVKRSEGRGDGSQGLPAPNNVRQLQITLGWKASAFRPGNSESGMRENRDASGFDERREADGHWPSGFSIRRFPPALHADGRPIFRILTFCLLKNAF